MPLLLVVIFVVVIILVSCSTPTNLVENKSPRFKSAYPPNGATKVPTDVTLSWEFEDPDNNIVRYEYRISKDKNNLGNFKGTDKNFAKVPLDLATTYYWEVVAIDTFGAKASSGVLSFTTERPPVKPYNPSPADDTFIYVKSIDLNWECYDPDGDEVVYDLYFGETNPPPLKAKDLKESTYRVDNLEEKTYYWKVVAKSDGLQAESEVWSFSVSIPVGSNLFVLAQYRIYEVDATNITSPTTSLLFELTSGKAIDSYNNNVYVVGDNGIAVYDSRRLYQNSEFKGHRIIVKELLSKNVKVVAGDLYAFVADKEVLKILDVKDPSNIGKVAEFLTNNLKGFFVEDSKVYLCEENMLKVVDVSSPASPAEVAKYEFDSEYPIDVYVVDNFAYVITDKSLWKFDVSSESEIKEEKQVSLTGNGKRVYYDSGFVLALTDQKLYRFSSDFSSKLEINLSNGNAVVAKSGYVYVGTSNGLKIFDMNLSLVGEALNNEIIEDICFAQ